MKTCFVIQPFDNGKFDKRYDDVFVPAIKESGLHPYRVDKDAGNGILIEDIESGIRDAEIVLADITLDNPNVWYELGFSFSAKKDVVMVCCMEERANGKFPFDIQHRSVITYKAGSKSDFVDLEAKIRDKISAYLAKARVVETIVNTPVKDLDGLKSHEVAILLILMEKGLGRTEPLSTYMLQDYMNKGGFNPIATGVGITVLSKYGFIEKGFEVDNYNGENYPVCKLTPKGEEWILENQHLITFEKPREEDELPF